MSTQTQSSDVYSMYKQNVQKYFENISKITPQYFQSITHLQEECMKACEKTINASVAMSQEIAKKSGITSEVPSSVKTFNDNVNAFADLNKNIIQSWITPFTQKN
jgi:TRAP-type mannitol/chloroaromatic compound transport system substrate-binding protein